MYHSQEYLDSKMIRQCNSTKFKHLSSKGKAWKVPTKPSVYDVSYDKLFLIMILFYLFLLNLRSCTVHALNYVSY